MTSVARGVIPIVTSLRLVQHAVAALLVGRKIDGSAVVTNASVGAICAIADAGIDCTTATVDSRFVPVVPWLAASRGKGKQAETRPSETDDGLTKGRQVNLQSKKDLKILP